MSKRIAILMISAALVAAAAAAQEPTKPQVPNCEVFRQRFAEAPRVLSLRLPGQKLHSEPPELGDDTWRADGTRGEDGEMWYGTDVPCRDGKFVDVTSEIDPPGGALHPTFDLIAASIYAYTGWDAAKVIRSADQVMKGRSPEKKVVTELVPGTYEKILFGAFAIELFPE